MQGFRVATIATLALGALAGCTPQPSAPLPTANVGSTDGTVTFTGGAVAIGVGFQWGSGTLTYQGRQYPFRLRGRRRTVVGTPDVVRAGIEQAVAEYGAEEAIVVTIPSAHAARRRSYEL